MERWGGREWLKEGECPNGSLPAEDVLGVAGPDLVLALVRTAGKGAGARRAAGHHVEAGLRKLIEGLLQKVELEVVARSVALRGTVRVSALVQGLPEYLFSQRCLATHCNPRHPPELGVRLRVPPDGVGAPVADGDVARTPAAVQGLGWGEQRAPGAPRRAAAS